MKNILVYAAAVAACFCVPASAGPVTFETLDRGDPGSDGSTDYNSSGEYYWNGSNESGGFSVSGVNFENTFTDFGGGFTSWTGFAYSETTDTTTPGFTNQYSAIPGSGAGGSNTFGIAYNDASITYDTPFDFSDGKGFFVTNTTYAYLDILNGSGFSKAFGGPSGDDPDWFLLSITGSNGASTTGTIDVYLADYRFADNGQDYILDQWTFVNLQSLGSVDTLSFELTSSDVGSFGMNTPAYFALDNVGAVPEPGALLLVLAGGVILSLHLRKRGA